MTTVRVIHNKENPYVIINRASLWDPNLSLDAVGLWARLLSRPDDWVVRTSELQKSCKVGKDKIRSLLNELIDNGYAYRFQTRKEGSFAEWTTYVFETKKTPEEIQKMLPETENAAPVNAAPPNAPLLSNESTKTVSKDTSVKREEDARARATPPPEKIRYGKFIELSKEEFDSLRDFCGGTNQLSDIIDQINDFMESTGKKYRNFPATIRNWKRRDTKWNHKWSRTKSNDYNTTFSAKDTEAHPSMTSNSLADMLKNS